MSQKIDVTVLSTNGVPLACIWYFPLRIRHHSSLKSKVRGWKDDGLLLASIDVLVNGICVGQVYVLNILALQFTMHKTLEGLDCPAPL